MQCIKFTSALFLAAIFPLCSHAASFDCAKAASPTEKLICSNPSVSLLDEQLGQAYKQALASASDKDSLKQEQMGWLKQQRACKDAECLTQTYQARIAQLQKGQAVIASTQPTQATPTIAKTATKKASFKITEGQGVPLCEEYLKVLNRTAWDDLQACKLPDLTGSPIQEVKSKAVSAEMQNELDQIIFEQTGDYPGVKWVDAQLARKKQYEIGYRALGVLNWDLNKDGADDLIVEYSQPWSYCEPLYDGHSVVTSEQVNARWATLTEAEKISKSKLYGFKKHYSLINNNKLFFTDADNMVIYSGDYFSISHIKLRHKNNHKQFPDRNYVYISSLNPEIDAKNKVYVENLAKCRFSLN